MTMHMLPSVITPGKLIILTLMFTASFSLDLKAQKTLFQDSATIFINETDTLFTKVDTIVTYPGGMLAWARFLNRTLRYPQAAVDNEIMGETRISFIVQVDSTASDIKAIYGDPILAAESERIMSLSGKWSPAIYKGQAVKSYRIIPITYRLETDGERRSKKKRK